MLFIVFQILGMLFLDILEQFLKNSIVDKNAALWKKAPLKQHCELARESVPEE